MTPFEKALSFTLRWEGGFSNNPADPGGRTDHGIAERYHPEAWADGKVTAEEAKAIYRNDYWVAIQGDKLPEPVAIAMFDCAVNPGVMRSIQFLQWALDVRADGRFGVMTAVSLNGKDAREIALRIVDARAGYWIAKAAGEKVVFREGWLNRNRELRQLLKGA